LTGQRGRHHKGAPLKSQAVLPGMLQAATYTLIVE
jgi:hypothetical protein